MIDYFSDLTYHQKKLSIKCPVNMAHHDLSELQDAIRRESLWFQLTL